MKSTFSSQKIEDLILGIEFLIKDRCSLLDHDRKLLQEVIVILQECRGKRNVLDAATLLLIVRAVELLTKFFS